MIIYYIAKVAIELECERCCQLSKKAKSLIQGIVSPIVTLCVRYREGWAQDSPEKVKEINFRHVCLF